MLLWGATKWWYKASCLSSFAYMAMCKTHHQKQPKGAGKCMLCGYWELDSVCVVGHKDKSKKLLQADKKKETCLASTIFVLFKKDVIEFNYHAYETCSDRHRAWRCGKNTKCTWHLIITSPAISASLKNKKAHIAINTPTWKLNSW